MITFDGHKYQVTTETANGNTIDTVLTESGDHVDTITFDSTFEAAFDSFGDVFGNYFELMEMSESDRHASVVGLAATGSY